MEFSEKEIRDALKWRLRRNENLGVWKEDEITAFKKQHLYNEVTDELIGELKATISVDCLEEIVASYKACLKNLNLFNHL